MKIITTKPGEIIDFETVFAENEKLLGEPEHCGRFERLDYTTDVYEDGIVHPKYCNVYLPWCYDPADADRKYNVVYYQHGNTLDPEYFTVPERKKMLDCLFDCPEIEPVILVFTTVYFDCVKDADIRADTGYVPAGDGNYRGVKANFWKEVIGDLIPLVESRYRTYTAGTDPEALIAARDHRAFSGYSRGAICTWYMFHHAMEYFRWYAPMSGHTTAGKIFGDPVSIEEAIAYVTKSPLEKPDLPFFIYASNGGPEDVKIMTQQMKHLTKQPCFSYGTDPGKNNICYSLSEFPHSDHYAPFYYYNSLQLLFRA